MRILACHVGDPPSHPLCGAATLEPCLGFEEKGPLRRLFFMALEGRTGASAWNLGFEMHTETWTFKGPVTSCRLLWEPPGESVKKHSCMWSAAAELAQLAEDTAGCLEYLGPAILQHLRQTA